jgi:F-type H+-transporting ATPase subunit delta
MSIHRIASRYAKSLITLAQDEKKLEIVYNDVLSLDKIVDSNRDLYLLLKSPIINPDKKGNVINAIFSGKVDKTTLAFLNILVKKGREMYFPEIFDSFIHQYKDLNNISTVLITTASKMDDETLDKIKNKLMQSSITQEKVEIETKVDPDLLGGFVIEIEDKLYDASVAHQLDELKREFKNNDFKVKF